MLSRLPFEACGKTGTAQNHGRDHSAFMGFAPMKNPKIAIAVYVENGGWGADFGVPIGGLMMEQYIMGKLSPSSEKQAEAMQHRHLSYGPRYPALERAKKEAEARRKAALKNKNKKEEKNVPEAKAAPDKQ